MEEQILELECYPSVSAETEGYVGDDWDGASIHKSKKVNQFVQTNEQYKDIFNVHFLPPYSPQPLMS
jgi:hypothetical protein